MGTCEEWMKKGYIEKCLNGVHLEEEEETERKERLQNSWIQEVTSVIRERERNWQHGMDRQRRLEKKNKIKTLSTERCRNILFI